MTTAEHKKVHIKLHKNLDVLVADYIQNTEKTLSETSLMEFMKWAYKETLKPSE